MLLADSRISYTWPGAVLLRLLGLLRRQYSVALEELEAGFAQI